MSAPSHHPYCLTLIASPARAGLSETLAQSAASLLAGGAPEWLAKGIACDIPCPALPDDTLSARLDSLIGTAPIDTVWLERKTRRKQVLAADMDATIILEESLDVLATQAQAQEEIAAITAAGMEGRMEFAQSLTARMKHLAELEESFLAATAEKLTLRAGAKTLIATMQAHGGKCLLLSGGLSFFARHIARRVGFDDFKANEAIIKDGKLTGEIALPIQGAEAKQRHLEAFAAQAGLAPDDVLAVGDGANDAQMIQRAGLGVAFHAKPALAQVADIHIRHGDLTSLLFIQGFRQSEFV